MLGKKSPEPIPASESGFIFPLSLQVEVLAAFGKTFADHVTEIRMDTMTATVWFFSLDSGGNPFMDEYDQTALDRMTIPIDRGEDA